MLNHPLGTKNVGFFKIESGKAMISDPCYDRNVKCHGSLIVKNGLWNAFVELSDEYSWGKRVAELRCEHENHRDINPWIKADFEVGVVSGQAGVFDDKYYKDVKVVANMTDAQRMCPDKKVCADDPWYSFCCDRTLSQQHAGVIPFGAVSSSGFGDGGYTCYYHEDISGQADAIKIIFINDEESEDGLDRE